MPIYDEKHVKAKVREFNGVIKTNFWGNEVPKEGVHDIYIACITINSVMKIEKKNYPQVYFEVCKNRIKEAKMSEFIDAELESNSSSGSE